MHILLTNDDGYQATGIRTLYTHLKSLGHRVTLIAPHTQRSAQSHAMTFYQPVQAEQIEQDIFSITGTPADCVAIGLAHILKNSPPDIVVSGINHGLNVGVDVNYSGTVGAATEAALMGYKAIAVSMDNVTSVEQQIQDGFEKAAKLIGNILKNIQEIKWPKLHILNVNTPLHYKEIAVAQCGSESLYIPHIEELTPQSQKELKLYLIGGISRHAPNDISQDVSLVESGFATLSFISAKQSSDSKSDLSKLVGLLVND